MLNVPYVLYYLEANFLNLINPQNWHLQLVSFQLFKPLEGKIQDGVF
jgi:hypothetical protein